MNEILEIIAEEWDRDPARVIAAGAAIPVVVIVGWLGLVVYLVAFA